MEKNSGDKTRKRQIQNEYLETPLPDLPSLALVSTFQELGRWAFYLITDLCVDLLSSSLTVSPCWRVRARVDHFSLS